MRELLRVPHVTAELRAAGQRPRHPRRRHPRRRLADDRSPSGQLEEDLIGICPDIHLYDLRVLDDSGRGDEFAVMAALQFVRFLNSATTTPSSTA